MARGAPGVVSVQENAVTQTKSVTLPKNVLEDTGLNARDLVWFVKRATGWHLCKITMQQKQRIREAYRNGESVADILHQLTPA